MASLYAIGDDLLRLLDTVRDDRQIDDQLDMFFTGVAEQEAEKFDGYIGVIRTLEAEIAICKAEIDQFTAKKKSRENNVKRLKDRLKEHLERTGRTKATTAAGRTLRVQTNGVAPLVIDDGAVIPVPFARVVVTPDTDAIREALDRGEVLPFARLEPRGTHLRIG